ncbi:MAG: tetratricopeptide repeat protein [Opitutaceae bacterium]
MAKLFFSGEIDSSSTRWQQVVARGFIFCAILLAYLPAVNGGFLWDDDAHVTKESLRSLEGLRRIWFELGASQQYYPVLHTAFWVEHRLWGDSILGYHLTNLLLHATAACLVVAIVRRLFEGRTSPTAAHSATPPAPGSMVSRFAGIEWVAGFIFALHPVCVESVAWISEQKNTLSAVFYLGSALIYLRFDRDRKHTQYFQALGLFVLALLSKTVTATLPAALLLIFWWQRGRLDWRRDVLPLVPWFLLGVTGGLLTAWVEHTFFVSVQVANGAPGESYALTLLERSLLAGRAICFYLSKLVWPGQLMFTYPRWNIDAAVAWQYLFPLGVATLLAILIRIARYRRGPLVGFLFFCGTLFPALGFINLYPFIYSYVADHFQYLASLGIVVPLAAGLILLIRSPAGRAGAVTLIATLGILACQQSRIYRDVVTLYRETLARNPSSWMAHSNLGLILAKDPQSLPEALSHFESAVRLNPKNAEVHNYLGSALARIPGRKLQAIAEFETALRLSPEFPHAHVNLGIALLEDPGRLQDALAHLERATLLKPDLPEAHHLLGSAYARIPGRQADAIARFETALRLNPRLTDAHSNLAIALAAIPARMPEAIRHFEAAAELSPTSVAAHYNLGRALADLPERLPDALAQFEAAVRIDPQHAEAQFALGIVLANLPGRANEALVHFEAALKIKPDHQAARQWLDALRGPRR